MFLAFGEIANELLQKLRFIR